MNKLLLTFLVHFLLLEKITSIQHTKMKSLSQRSLEIKKMEVLTSTNPFYSKKGENSIKKKPPKPKPKPKPKKKPSKPIHDPFKDGFFGKPYRPKPYFGGTSFGFGDSDFGDFDDDFEFRKHRKKGARGKEKGQRGKENIGSLKLLTI